jgi:hypothetical protein
VFLGNLRRADLGAGGKTLAEFAADICHGGKIRNALMVDPFHQLQGAVGFFTQTHQEILQSGTAHPEQVDTRGCLLRGVARDEQAGIAHGLAQSRPHSSEAAKK